MKMAHELRVLCRNGLIVVVNEQTEILSIRRFRILKELFKARNDLLESLLANTSLRTHRVKMSFIDTFREQARPIPATHQLRNFLNQLPSFPKGQVNVRLGLLVVLLEFGVSLGVSEFSNPIDFGGAESDHFGTARVLAQRFKPVDPGLLDVLPEYPSRVQLRVFEPVSLHHRGDAAISLAPAFHWDGKSCEDEVRTVARNFGYSRLIEVT